MKDESIVKCVAEYLESVKEDTGAAYSLVQLIDFVDHKNKSIPTLEEILDGICMVGGICLGRRDHLIYFGETSALAASVETISEADLQFASHKYGEESRSPSREMSRKRKQGGK